MRIGKNTPWLVKTSGGRILGPFFDKDLINRLRTREIALIDEVSRPCGRWVYIRDEPAFASVTEEIRQKNLRMTNDSDDSTARAEMTLTPTSTVSLTDPVSSNLDDRTEEISNVYRVEPQVETPRENISAETFVFEGDRVVRAEVQGTARWWWALTTIVIFAAAGFVVFKKYVARPIQDRAVAQQNLGEAEEAMAVGDYERALQLYRRAYESLPVDKKTYLPYALLLVQVGNRTVEARRLLEDLLANQERDREKILTASAMAFLSDKRFKDAEAHLNRALDVNQLYYPAMINMGILGLETGDPEKANNHLQLAVKEGSRDGAAHLLLVKTLVSLYEKDKDKSYLQQAKQYLRHFTERSHDYLQEALVASIFVDSLLGETTQIARTIEHFLEIDPQQTEMHKHDLYVYRKAMDWTTLNQWCLRATDGLDPLARLVAFEAMCLLKAGELKEANLKIQDAVQQAPRDSLVHAVYGYVLEKTNAEDQARVVYDKAIDFNAEQPRKLPYILKARLCEKFGDTACAARMWRELLRIHPHSLPALAGLAAESIGKGDHATAENYLRRGQAISENYRPFLSMRAALGAQP